MTLIELRDILIEEGIKSIHENEKRPEKIRGGLGGFELCRILKTPQDYEKILQERQQEEVRLVQEKVPSEEYWEYRMATTQIEFVWERLRVALRYGHTFSARAIMHVAEIMDKQDQTS